MKRRIMKREVSMIYLSLHVTCMWREYSSACSSVYDMYEGRREERLRRRSSMTGSGRRRKILCRTTAAAFWVRRECSMSPSVSCLVKRKAMKLFVSVSSSLSLSVKRRAVRLISLYNRNCCRRNLSLLYLFYYKILPETCRRT